MPDFSADVPSSCSVLVSALAQSDEPVDILETGPCTNIAEVIRDYPELKRKINRIYMMGGAVHIKGNVVKAGHNGSAEWNIYNNPKAFETVLSSGIKITMISLDATQYTPIRHEFMKKLRQFQDKRPFRFVYESLNVIKFLIDIGQYMFWDTLTSAVIINPDIVKTEKVKIKVILNGPSMGRTIETKEHGFDVDLAICADRDLFEKTVFSILNGDIRLGY
jgi:purine nucleosidase